MCNLYNKSQVTLYQRRIRPSDHSSRYKTGEYWENERLRLINESIEKANPMKHVDAENMKKIQPLPSIQEGEIEQNNSMKQTGSINTLYHWRIIRDTSLKMKPYQMIPQQ